MTTTATRTYEENVAAGRDAWTNLLSEVEAEAIPTVDLPDSLREEAARAAERVVTFEQADFVNIVDAIAPLLAPHFIEVGARAGIEEFDRYFRNEDENLTTAEYREDPDAPDGASWVRHTEAEFESFAKGAVFEVLSGLKR